MKYKDGYNFVSYIEKPSAKNVEHLYSVKCQYEQFKNNVGINTSKCANLIEIHFSLFKTKQ